MSADTAGNTTAPAVLSLAMFEALLGLLRSDGFELVGPTVRDNAIVHSVITGIGDLPRGWTEVQDAGRYRLKRREDNALFGYSVGPQSWKQLFFTPRLRLFKSTRDGDSFQTEVDQTPPPKLALIGARSCDLHAIEIQDRTFIRGAAMDPDYAARRRDVFTVAVNCGQAGGTCFCVSMNTGPRVTEPFDLALTELLDGEHRFLAEAGSARGTAMLERVAARTAPEADCVTANAIVERTAASMGRSLDTDGIKELLYRNLENPQWDAVANQCLSCTNCTMVCPTCFCSTVDDTTDLSGDTAERWRTWDSCFTLDHSHVHGGSVRGATKARYRQWLTHKFASWIDQFGSSGCVGCGRCATWCPVGIDVTQQLGLIRATDGQRT